MTQREREIIHQGETVKQIMDILHHSERKLSEDMNIAVRHKLNMLDQQKRKAMTNLGQVTDCVSL